MLMKHKPVVFLQPEYLIPTDNPVVRSEDEKKEVHMYKPQDLKMFSMK